MGPTQSDYSLYEYSTLQPTAAVNWTEESVAQQHCKHPPAFQYIPTHLTIVQDVHDSYELDYIPQMRNRNGDQMTNNISNIKNWMLKN